MKKSISFLILLVLLCAIFFATFAFVKGKIKRDFTRGLPAISEPKVTLGPSVAPENVRESIFVPYWSIGAKTDIDTTRYQTLYYFGIQATVDGIDTDDPGFTKLPSFVKASGNAKRELVIRMVDKQEALSVLKSTSAQQKVIDDALAIAQENDFSGVVLDLEIAALPFDSLLQQVQSFTSRFAQASEEENLDFSIAVYGDTFYRVRPYDIKALAKVVPSFLIMAYDFHKAGGNPGPNFPLAGGETYGYDFETMLSNFLEYMSPDKITVVFGLYGYDWEVDEKGNATATGVARTLSEIRSSFLPRCQQLSCSSRRDGVSSEMVLTYSSEENGKHIMWFEDEQSVKKKEALAKRLGVSRFSYWAYSYF